jgi:transposase
MALIAQRLQQDGHCFISKEPAHIAQHGADDVLRRVDEMRQHAIMRLSGFEMRESVNRLHDNELVCVIEIEEGQKLFAKPYQADSGVSGVRYAEGWIPRICSMLLISPTPLTDAEWALLEPLWPPESPMGRPRLHSLRIIRNAIFYQLRTGGLRTGGAWRFLPQEWPPWQTVYSRWRRDGTWERIHRSVREWLRQRVGRDQEPSAGSSDSQSVKTR